MWKEGPLYDLPSLVPSSSRSGSARNLSQETEMLGHHLVFVVCILHFEIIFSTLYLILKKKNTRQDSWLFTYFPYLTATHPTVQHSTVHYCTTKHILTQYPLHDHLHRSPISCRLSTSPIPKRTRGEEERDSPLNLPPSLPT